MSSSTFKLFADYFQFYLQDENAKGDLSESWTKEAVTILLALAPGTIGVGTVRNMFVPVTVDVVDAPPALDLSKWDHVVECDIDLPSGRVVVAGCTEYFPDAARIRVTPGHYRARINYGDLDRLSEDRLEGEDHYHVALWRAPPAGVRVLKQYPPRLERAV